MKYWKSIIKNIIAMQKLEVISYKFNADIIGISVKVIHKNELKQQ
jgi:hypothetical protein